MRSHQDEFEEEKTPFVTNEKGGSRFTDMLLSFGGGVLAGSVVGMNSKEKQESVTPTFPGYIQFIDLVLATMTEAQLISFAMSLIKVNYLRAAYRLDNEWAVEQSTRTRHHLVNCMTKALKTPFSTKLVVYKIKGFHSSLLLSDGAFIVKNAKIVGSQSEGLIKPGVTDILSRILTLTQEDAEITVQTSRRVGAHNRFSLSPMSTVFEALAYNNKSVKTYDDLMAAMSLYYGVLYSNLSDRTRATISHPNFRLEAFCTLNYKQDGCGHLSNFYQLF